MTEMRKTDLVRNASKGLGKYVRKDLGKQVPEELCVRNPSGVSPSLRLTLHGNTERESGKVLFRGGVTEVLFQMAFGRGIRFEPVDKRTCRQRERGQFMNSLRYGGPHI